MTTNTTPSGADARDLLLTFQSWIGPRRPERGNPDEQRLWDRIDAAIAALSAAQDAPVQAAQAVPQGWKLVPVEPTDEMVRSTHHLDLSYMPTQWAVDRAAVYRAMLAAAPAAPQQQDERGEFYSWIRTHEDEHGAVDDASAWAGWMGRAALAAQAVDGLGMPTSCGKPLCAPGDHHPLCQLAAPQPAAQQWDERQAFEAALTSKPDARFWNTTDAMFWAWQARAELSAAQAAQAQEAASAATPCLPDGLRYKLPPLELTGHQVKQLADMAHAADTLDAIWKIKELKPLSAYDEGGPCAGGVAATTEGQPGYALLSAAPAGAMEATIREGSVTWSELEDFRKRHWSHWSARDNLLIAHLVQTMRSADIRSAAPAAQGEPSEADALQRVIEDPARAMRLFQSWIDDRDATRDELKGEILRRAAQQKGGSE